MHSENNLNFGIIGNCKSAALINENGSIDWFCLPEFDSPSVFAKILDDNKGGGFWINTKNNFKTEQKYLGDSCILITKFKNKGEAFEVIDFMPRFQTEKGQYYAPPELIRFIKPIKGAPEIQIQYDPRLEYAKGKTFHKVENNSINSQINVPSHDSLFLYTNCNKQSVLSNKYIILEDSLFFNISYNEKLKLPTLSKCLLFS